MKDTGKLIDDQSVQKKEKKNKMYLSKGKTRIHLSSSGLLFFLYKYGLEVGGILKE